MLEAIYGWYWAADVLAELGAWVHLVHPLGMMAFKYRWVKNDAAQFAAALVRLLFLVANSALAGSLSNVDIMDQARRVCSDVNLPSAAWCLSSSRMMPA